MAFERYEFSDLSRAEAEAIGVPGQRRFRLIFASGMETAVLWMEKQQLQALGLAFVEMIAQLREANIAGADVLDVEPPPVGPVSPTAAEIEIGRLSVGYDEENARVVLIIHGPEAGEDDAPGLIARLRLQQVATLATQIERVVAAGRPTCPRCGQPMNPEGHVCPHDNGHFPHLVGK